MKKIIFVIVIISLLILFGCNKISDAISEEKYEECLANKECFVKNMRICNKAIYSQCYFGMCTKASIEGEQNGKCIIRNWQSQNGEVINYDVTCLASKEIALKIISALWSDNVESEIITSDVGKGALKNKGEEKLKAFSPADMCKH